jgi:hypothetical protein
MGQSPFTVSPSSRREAQARVTGAVLLPDGSPASQASVEGFKNDADVGGIFCIADAEGRFRLLLEPSVEGPLRIRALSDSGAGPALEGHTDGISPGAAGVRITLAPMK